MTEDELERHMRKIHSDINALISGAATPRLLAYHTHDSRYSAAGFPDWVFCGPGGVMYRELKTEKGKVSPNQETWINALLQAGCDARVWRPADLLNLRIAHELGAIAGLYDKDW
jgi:hypothetical protein